MSGFDEALRRQEAQQRAQDVELRSQEDQRHRAAELAVPRITQLLREFSQRLSERGVQAKRVALTVRQGLRLPRYSPEGYELMARWYGGVRRDYGFIGMRKLAPTPTFLSLVTPDGRLWTYRASGGEGFVPITTDTVIGGTSNSTIWLDGDSYITFGRNGEAVVHRHGDPPTTTPLEEVLAASAMRLIQESSGQR